MREAFYKRVKELISRNGYDDYDIVDYYDDALFSISDDDNFCFYTKVMELKGFRELIRMKRLKIAFKETCDYAPGIKGDFIVLRPVDKTVRWSTNKRFSGFYFDRVLHFSEMFIIRPRKLRETISVCGIRPSTEYRLRTRYGFETEDSRIYIIIPRLIARLGECSIDDSDNAIRWAVNEYHTRHGDFEYDVWSVSLPLENDIRKDAAFEYGGYVVDAISPENLTLVNTIKYGEEHQNENIAKLKNDPELDISE